MNRRYAVALTLPRTNARYLPTVLSFEDVSARTPRAAARKVLSRLPGATAGTIRVVNDDHITEFPADAVPE